MDTPLDDSKQRSLISDSKFVEPHDNDANSIYSTPQASPVLGSALIERTDDHGLAATKPSNHTKQQPDNKAPEVPLHTDDTSIHHHNRADKIRSTIFRDQSTAQAIQSVRDRMAIKPQTDSKDSESNDEPVLLVRRGFENFSGFGVKCVENEKNSKSHHI